jgi:hypothetical protein
MRSGSIGYASYISPRKSNLISKAKGGDADQQISSLNKSFSLFNR